MLKIEKKALEWAEKHMYSLTVLLVCALALYMRRGAIWWSSPDVGAYFDWHENHIQSAFYYALVRLAQYIPMLPLHVMKWLYSLADLAVILLGVMALDGDWKKLSLRKILFLIVFTLSPVSYLRGAVWAQPDSLAFGLILLAYLLWNRGWRKRAMVPAVLGVALYPCFILLVIGYLWLCDRGDGKKAWIYFTVLFAAVLVFQGFNSVILGSTWKEGIRTCFRWMAYEPYEGILYKTNGIGWILQMINVCGYGAAMTSALLAYRKKLPYIAAVGIQLAVLLVYGSLLFPVS